MGNNVDFDFRVLTLKRDDILSHGNDVMLWTCLVVDRSNPTGLQSYGFKGKYKVRSFPEFSGKVPRSLEFWGTLELLSGRGEKV